MARLSAARRISLIGPPRLWSLLVHHMYPDSGKRCKWLVYPLGCLVFATMFYFGLSRFLGLSTVISLAISLPAGVVGFFAFAMVAENWESGGWDIGG